MRKNNLIIRIIFYIILGLVIYRVLLSAGVAPYVLGIQEIIVYILLLIALSIVLLSHNLTEVSLSVELEKEQIEGGRSEDFSEISSGIEQFSGKLEECETFLRIQNYFKEGFDRKQIINKLLVAAARLTRSERASIMLLDERNESLYIYKTLGWSREDLRFAKGMRVKPGEGIAGRVFVEEKPLIMNEPDETEDLELRDKYRTKSFMSLPIYSGDDVIGVLNLTEKSDGNYTDKDEKIVTFIIREAALTLKIIELEKK